MHIETTQFGPLMAMLINHVHQHTTKAGRPLLNYLADLAFPGNFRLDNLRLVWEICGIRPLGSRL
jgi:hypothetical protein